MHPIEDAWEYLQHQVIPVKATESCPLNQAFGRLLAIPPEAAVNVPPADNSAMDGYALNLAELKNTTTPLPISQKILAGQPALPLAEGSVARLFTGSQIPPGADTVIIQEHCVREGEQVTFQQFPPVGSHIRRRGEDIPRGMSLLHQENSWVPGTLPCSPLRALPR